MRRFIPLFVALLALAFAAHTAAVSAQDAPPLPPPIPQGPPGTPGRAAPDPTRRDLGAYRLRVEDQVEISVYKPGSFSTDLTRQVVVPANGEISFAPLGRINLLGRTTGEVEEAVAQQLKDAQIFTNPNVGVFVTKYSPRTVSIIGAVRASVELPVYKDLRILELLSRVGGLESEGADFSRVMIRRIGADGRPFPFEVNVDKVFRELDEQQNVVVKEGDIIYVPRLEGATPTGAEFVYVLGKVRTPGRTPIIRGPYPFTLVKLISVCGDFTEFANRSKIRVIRQTATGRQTFILDFDDIIENERADFEMKADDIVSVPESFL